MAAVQEVHSFVNKFLNLCMSGKKANLSLKCENKTVAIDLQLDLDLASCLPDSLFTAPPYPPRQPCARPSPSRMRRCGRRRNRARTETKENVEVTEKVAVPTIRSTKVVTEQVAPVLTEKHGESFDNHKVHQKKLFVLPNTVICQTLNLGLWGHPSMMTSVPVVK